MLAVVVQGAAEAFGAVRLVDPGTGVNRQIATLTDVGYADLFWGPVISPDANVILYAKDMTRGHDLMLIENFR